MGGNDGATSLDSCERYDPHLNKWTMIASMKQRRAGAGAAEINGKIYMIGAFLAHVHLSCSMLFLLQGDSTIMLL